MIYLWLVMFIIVCISVKLISNYVNSVFAKIELQNQVDEVIKDMRYLMKYIGEISTEKPDIDNYSELIPMEGIGRRLITIISFVNQIEKTKRKDIEPDFYERRLVSIKTTIEAIQLAAFKYAIHWVAYSVAVDSLGFFGRNMYRPTTPDPDVKYGSMSKDFDISLRGVYSEL